MQGAWNSRCISDCLSSSRLKTMSLRGCHAARTISVNSRPNEPVPPVTRMTLPFRSSAIASLPSQEAPHLIPEPRPGHLKLSPQGPRDPDGGQGGEVALVGPAAELERAG